MPPLKFIFFLFSFLLCFSSGNSYEVHFNGISDSKTLKLIQESSRLEKLKDSPSPTCLKLKRRSEADVVNIRNVLHSQAYYDAKIDFFVAQDCSSVSISIDPGPQFPLSSFEILYFEDAQELCQTDLNDSISLEKLKVQLGNPALPDTILSAEDTLLDELNLMGYAFATVLKRSVIADEKEKQVHVTISVETGPLAVFGELKITGLERVKECFIKKKLRWREGDRYDPKKIDQTQNALELSTLFRSVSISQKEGPVNQNEVPIEIALVEGKQRSIGFGLNYNTELGFGASGEWENRNHLGQGNKLSTRAEIWQRMQDARISYVIPDYGHQDQNLIGRIDYHQDHNKSFTEKAFSVSGTIERRWNEYINFSYGLMYKILRSERSARNGTFDLIKTPLKFSWNRTDNLLDPSKGTTLIGQVIPTVQIGSPQFFYCITNLTGTYYKALSKNKKTIFATKLMLGSIFGGSKKNIPPPERFLAGSETTLRGYRFMTVSPLGRQDKPLGGSSLFVYSLELRHRFKDNLGIVLFYDVGNVFKNDVPQLQKKLLQSTGLGIRYYTPVGPIRLDLAVPLNRRKKNSHKKGYFDRPLEAYFSIGQSF